MKYYIIAGERSGDLHGANFIKSLKEEDQGAIIRGCGGELMEGAGATLALHYKEMALMGFKEVLTGINKILKNLALVKSDISGFKPDVIVLIDFAGFNLKIAKFAKENGLKVFYYISPKVWAWNQSRALKIKKLVDKMFVILPFEKEFYEKYDYSVDYVGNPLVDSCYAHQVNDHFRSENNIDSKPIIAILPGSRKQEVEYLLSSMISIVPQFSQYNFIVAAVDNLPEEVYQKAGVHSNVKILYNQTYDLLAHSHAALVTSGTATLETALFEVPQVVCYKTSGITYFIARALIKVNYISLVNLIAGKEIVKELIQGEYNPLMLAKEFEKIASDNGFRSRQISNYQKIKKILGQEKASPKLARLIVKYLRKEVTQL